MISTDAGRTYEEWRELWLSGKASHAIQALRFHGLRTALELAGGTGGRERTRRSASAPVVATGLFVGDALVAEATRQIRQLLGGAAHG